MSQFRKFLLLFLFLGLAPFFLRAEPKVSLGVDVFFKEGYDEILKNKRVGIITNHTGVNGALRPTIDIFKERSGEFTVAALFTPEHGLNGVAYAGESVESGKKKQNIPIHSLHGKTRRPTEKMLKGIDVLIFDIQEIGARSYTYATTLFYVMEEAAKKGIDVIVLDRPNPLNGVMVDGPMLKAEWRSFVGYINVPYCHGMTIGELARFFNEEYKVGCKLKVVLMEGWERTMTFKDTGLTWIPTSPQVPEPDTPLFYASTGILGELSIANIGVGYSLPFKVVGAPWIRAQEFADRLNAQNLPGVTFFPFYFRPFFGLYSGKDCQGVKIIITQATAFRPLTVEYLLIGMLKALYPKEVKAKLQALNAQEKKMFCQVNGNEEILSYIMNEKYPAWKMIHFDEEGRKEFLEKRKKYLLY